ncbi:MAG: hypothetical protein GXX00_11225 [Hungateiclostridium thermocellum]|nr:hypothetical protein [Acetivibrio thermocellus]
MGKKKNLTMLISFCIGAVLFVSTAFADVVSKTGYEQFKDAIKNTVGSLAEEYDSFTTETGLSVKDNDRILAANYAIEKYDMVNSRREEVSTSEWGGIKTSNYYSYRDKWCNIYSVDEDTYYVNEYETEMKDAVRINNVFEDEDFEYIERIFDALIGNLKEYVVVTEDADGNKEFSGKLSDAQIPAVVNAVIAYAAKKTVFDESQRQNGIDLPVIKNDVFVKEVRGRANLNGDGIIENLFGEIIVSGSEENGTKHDFKIELVFKVYNINSTVVEKPDLTGKKVEKTVVQNGYNSNALQKYMGKWKNDIVIEESDRFVKIGERIIEITSFDSDYVYGTYTEIYKDEYADYGSSNSYSLKANINEERGRLEITDASGNVTEGYMYLEMGRIDFYIPSEKPEKDVYNPIFNKVFDEE